MRRGARALHTRMDYVVRAVGVIGMQRHSDDAGECAFRKDIAGGQVERECSYSRIKKIMGRLVVFIMVPYAQGQRIHGSKWEGLS